MAGARGLAPWKILSSPWQGGEGRGDGGGASEGDWIPPKNAVPFGPFLVAGALEWLWLGDLIASWIPMLRVFR